jgi:hypothetical protein
LGSGREDLKMKKLFLLIIIFCVLLIPYFVSAGSYYVSPSGSDSWPGTSSQPWATFLKAMGIIQPGDTLLLKDGTYYQSLDVTRSGTSDNPITIKAENDGKAIIDGQGNKMPCRVNGILTNHLHDIIVEGIICKNSNEDVIYIRDADRITLNRVSAYNAADGNFVQFSLWRTTYVTLTECAASGNGRKQYNLLDTQYTKMHRCWGRWVSEVSGYGGYTGISIYNSNYVLAENNVLTSQTGTSVKAFAIAGQYGSIANYNELYGNVVYNHGLEAFLVSSSQARTEGNRIINNVGIDNVLGIQQKADTDLQVKGLTLVDSQRGTNRGFQIAEDLSYTYDSNFAIKGDVRNSVFVNHNQGFNVVNNGGHLSGFTNDYNDLYNITNPYYNLAQPGLNEISIEPGFDTVKYGKGAYLMVPSALKGKGENGADIGAEIIYQYENRTLTNKPLWPWPMEDRICRETGFSVTYENNNGCAGGIWKTLDGVYDKSSCIDFDNDGYGTNCPNGLDCDDANANVHQTIMCNYNGNSCGNFNLCVQSCPVSPSEICNNNIDDNCNNQIDENCQIYSANNKTIKSIKTYSTITIDGNLNEPIWNSADSITFSNSGRSDNIAKVYTLYDNSNLYFAYDITDSKLETYNGDLWNEDGAEIFIDTLNDKTTSTNSNDYHIMANINDLKSPTSINVKTIKSTNKYAMEIAIPWTSINTQPSLGKKIGILIGNNDRDSNVSKQFDWLGIIDILPGSYSRPNLWGNLTLISRADSDKSSCVDTSELSTFINKWKSLNSDVSIKELIEVIGMWKKGC